MGALLPKAGITNQQWRRGSIEESYGILDSRFHNDDIFNTGNGLEQANWDQRAFRHYKNVPVALDATTGLLLPCWAFAAGDQATFAAAFVGWIDTPFNNKEKRVTVITGGNAMLEVALVTPATIPLGTGMMLADNPVETIDPLNPTDPAAQWLHPFFLEIATDLTEVIGYTRSFRNVDVDRVEISVVSNHRGIKTAL